MTDLARTLADGRQARLVSLALTILTALTVVLAPAARADGASIPDRIALALALVGAVGGVTHAAAHYSQRPMLHRIATPRIAWPLMVVGCAWLGGARMLGL